MKVDLNPYQSSSVPVDVIRPAASRRELLAAVVFAAILIAPVWVFHWFGFAILLWLTVYGDVYPIPNSLLFIEPAVATIMCCIGILGWRQRPHTAALWGLAFLLLPITFLAVGSLWDIAGF